VSAGPTLGFFWTQTYKYALVNAFADRLVLNAHLLYPASTTFVPALLNRTLWHTMLIA
jgi:hypothetical protein